MNDDAEGGAELDGRRDRELDSPTISLDAAGIDEIGVIPWPALWRRRLAQRVGIDRRWAVLWVVLAGLFSTGFTFTVLIVALEGIAGELDTSVSVLTWAITAPMLAFGVVGPAFGKAGDLWGHKRVFVGGLLLAAVFATASALAWNAATLVLFRALSGMAGSACGPASMAYINRMFADGERVKPLGYWSFIAAGSPVIGVVVCGPLIDSVGWRWIFALQAPMCAVAFVLALWLLPQTERGKQVRFDVWGSLTLGLGASSLLAAISQGRSWGWASAATVGCFVGAVVLLMVFVRIERRAVAPLVVLAWFRTRNFALPVTIQLLGNFAYMGGFFVIPQVLGERGLGLSITTVGNLVIPRPLAYSLVAPLAAIVTVKVGERIAGVAGSMALVASMLMWAAVGLDSGYLFIIVATALSGVGLGISSPALTALMAGSVDAADLGVAGAMQQLMAQLGAVLGAAVMATISASADVHDLGPFHVAFLVAAGVAAAGGVCAAFVHSSARSPA